MKFIVDADPADAPAVLAKMIEAIPTFENGRGPGWGWTYRIGGKDYFIRQTKTGLSASPSNLHKTQNAPAKQEAEYSGYAEVVGDMTVGGGDGAARAVALSLSVPNKTARIEQHRQHQQGDEIACSCGRRWPVGENHP